MKQINSAIAGIASAGLLALMSLPAYAGSSTIDSFGKMVKMKASQHFAAKESKYNHIATLAGIKKEELDAKRIEAAHTYKAWYDLKSAVTSHNPSAKDYKAVEMAAKKYSQANMTFIELQKDILAQNDAPIETVSIKSLTPHIREEELIGME